MYFIINYFKCFIGLMFLIVFFVLMDFYVNVEKDYSNKKEFQNIIGKKFVLQERILITKFNDSNQVFLRKFKQIFWNKSDYENYINNSENWSKSVVKICGVIEKGEILKIDRVLGGNDGVFGKIYRIVPVFQNHEFDPDEVDASFLFDWNTERGKDVYYFLVDKNILKEVSE